MISKETHGIGTYEVVAKLSWKYDNEDKEFNYIFEGIDHFGAFHRAYETLFELFGNQFAIEEVKRLA
jgi:hypothetical protein